MVAWPRIKLGTERYPALTGVRALGASVVFFDHLPLWPNAHVVINVMAFFYALSGFLIVRIYYEQAQLQWRWLAKYFVNRFARIYPVYFLLLTVAVLLYHQLRPGMLLLNYTLTHALFHGTTLVLQGSWSLTVEETFYLLAPAFMLLARRYAFFVPLALGWLLFAAALYISTLGVRFLGTPEFMLSTTFFGHFMEFFAGVYLALMIMRIEKTGPLRAAGSARTVTGLAGVCALIGAMVVVYRQVPLNIYAIVAINNFLIPLPIAVLYLGLLREDTILSRILSLKTAALLGRSSYSFYLLQSLIIDFVAAPILSRMLHARVPYVIVTFALTWILSVLLYIGYEEPLNVLIRRRFQSQERWVGMPATLFRR
jgi:peptidoglycan/LPS O-acetylase OafA/YrhL